MSVRALAKVSAGLVVVAAIVTAMLWFKLRAERAVTAGLQVELERSLAQRQIPAAPARMDAPPLVDKPDAPAVPAAAPPASPAVASNAGSRAAAVPAGVITEAELLKDPAYQKARLAMLRSSIEQTYPGLVEELELTGEEADRVFNLLAESQMAMTALASSPTGNMQQDEAATATQIRRGLQVLQAQQSQSLREMLGETRYAQWQEYQQTRSTRMQASAYANAIAQAGAPLDGPQLRTLTSAMIGEQKAMQQALLELGRTVNADSAESRAQAQEALRNRRSESNQRILDAAATRLSAQQLSLLRAQVEQQEAMRIAADRVRERAGAVPVPQ